MKANEQDDIKRRHWLYLGGEDGYNLVHRVVDIDVESDPKMPRLTTWSLPEQGDADEPGWTWAGLHSLFVKSFKPLGPPDESLA